MERIFQEYVMEAKGSGKSVLLSSHILSEVEKLCDQIGIIREGKIIETGSLSEMRHLTRTHLQIETKEPIPILHELKGVHNVEKKDATISLQVDTEQLEHVMKFVSKYGIVKLESAPPTLEDLFMRHYEGEKGKLPSGESEL